MSRRSLVQQIEEDALDGRTSLADALRKCIAVGGRSGSTELRDWAASELRGYEGPKGDMPSYRTLVAPLVIDGFTFNTHITGQLISAYDLPNVVREAGFSEELPLAHGVGELEEMVRATRLKGETIKLALPDGAMIAKLMTHEMRDQYRAVERVYWNVSPTAVVGVLDQIRTRLVALVAEVRAVSPDPNEPSAAAVNNAVEVAIYGKARDVNINTAGAGGSGSAIAGSPPKERPWWKSLKLLGAFIVGLATIAAAIIAWLQWK